VRPEPPDSWQDPGRHRPSPVAGAARMPRRRTDRVESAVGWVVGVLGVALVGVALLTGITLNAEGMRQAARDAVDRVPAVAVLNEPSGALVGADPLSGVTSGPQVPGIVALATWRAPDGSLRTGRIPVLGARPAGSTVGVWTDRDGALAEAPVDALQAEVNGIVGGVFVLLIGALGLTGVRAAARRWVARANAREWARGWAFHEPLWSGR